MPYIALITKTLWQKFLEYGPKIIAGIWMFFAGVHNYLWIVLSLVIVDVITGLIAAHKRKEKITSRKLRKGLLEKFALYMVLILTVFTLDLITQSVLHHEAFYFSFIVTFLISIYETVSIFENVNEIKPNIPFLSALTRIFKSLGEKTIEKLEDNVEDIAEKITDFKGITEKKKEDPGDVIEGPKEA